MQKYSRNYIFLKTVDKSKITIVVKKCVFLQSTIRHTKKSYTIFYYNFTFILLFTIIVFDFKYCLISLPQVLEQIIYNFIFWHIVTNLTKRGRLFSNAFTIKYNQIISDSIGLLMNFFGYIIFQKGLANNENKSTRSRFRDQEITSIFFLYKTRELDLKNKSVQNINQQTEKIYRYSVDF